MTLTTSQAKFLYLYAHLNPDRPVRVPHSLLDMLRGGYRGLSKDKLTEAEFRALLVYGLSMTLGSPLEAIAQGKLISIKTGVHILLSPEVRNAYPLQGYLAYLKTHVSYDDGPLSATLGINMKVVDRPWILKGEPEAWVAMGYTATSPITPDWMRPKLFVS